MSKTGMNKPIMDLRRLGEMADHEVMYVQHISPREKNKFGEAWWKVIERLDMKYNKGFFIQPPPIDKEIV